MAKDYSELKGGAINGLLHDLFQTIGNGSTIYLESVDDSLAKGEIVIKENRIDVLFKPVNIVQGGEKYIGRFGQGADWEYQIKSSGGLELRPFWLAWKSGNKPIFDTTRLKGEDLNIDPDFEIFSYAERRERGTIKGHFLMKCKDKDNNEWELWYAGFDKKGLKIKMVLYCKELQVKNQQAKILFDFEVDFPADLPRSEFEKGSYGKVVHAFYQETDFRSVGNVESQVWAKTPQMWRIEAVPTSWYMKEWEDNYKSETKYGADWKDLPTSMYRPPKTCPPIIIEDITEEEVKMMYNGEKYPDLEFSTSAIDFLRFSMRGDYPEDEITERWLSWYITKL